MIRFVITKKAENNYAFDLRPEIGERFIQSVRFLNEDACRRALADFRNEAQVEETYVRSTTIQGDRFYFTMVTYTTLTARSSVFNSPEARESVIETMKKYVADAPIDPVVVDRCNV